MGRLVVYGMIESAPCRTVLLTLNALNLDFEFKIVDITKGDHITEEFIKKNPLHTIPVLEDNGKFLWDSHAIAAYLVRKYGKTDTLYPKDVFKRAMVDQRLHFDSEVMCPTVNNVQVPILFDELTEIPQDKIDLFYEKLQFLETFLKQDYLAGNTMSIADFSILSTISILKDIIPIEPAKMPRLSGWVKRMNKLPYYEKANGRGAALLNDFLKAKLSSK